MAVSAELLRQLLALDEAQREELGRALLDPDDTDRFALAQELLGSVDDGLTESERAEIDAAIDKSLAELDAGKGIPFDEAMASLLAKRQRRAAL